MNRQILLAAMAVGATLLTMSGPVMAQQVLRLGSIVAPASVQAQAMDRFADAVNAKHVGIEIKTFHASQLGGGPEQVRNVQLGVQDMFMGGMVFWGDFSDSLRIAETPFSFASRAHFEKWVQSPYFDKIQKEISDKGGQRIINLGVLWRRGPFRVLLATKPVHNLEEFQTLRIRTWQSEVINRFYGKEGLGATPVTIPLGDVYVGMRQGVVDSLTLPFDLVVSMKFGEVAKYIMPWKEFWQVLPMSINEGKWQSLSDEQKKVITDAVDEAGNWYNDQLSASVDKWTQELKDQGVTFVDIDRKPFVEIIAKRNREWQKEGYWPKGLIDEIDSLK